MKDKDPRDLFPWPSIDWRLSKEERLQRIAARDALIFSFASNALVTVAWIAATIAGFNCYFQQQFRDIAIIGLVLMAIFAIVLAARLFMSVGEHANAFLDDPYSKQDIGKRVLWIVLVVPFVFVGAALVYATGAAVLQTTEYCIVLKASPWTPVEGLDY